MDALKTDKKTRTAKKLRTQLAGPESPVGNDPIDTLRILVREHRNVTRMSVATGHMGLTEVRLKNGDRVKRDIPPSAAARLEEVSDALSKDADALKRKIEKALRGLPIYEHFFKQVTFAVPMLAGYLVAECNMRGGPADRERDPSGVSYKSSKMRRFCGLGVDPETGRLERPTKGRKLAYNSTLRTQLFLAFDGLWKNQRHHTGNANAKYVTIWRNAKHRSLHLEGVEEHGTKDNGETAHRKLVDGKWQRWDGHAQSYGWHKAADVLIEDLYVVWRALEGLPVWPSYYAAKLGYEHGGKIAVNAPRLLTTDEALELVGLRASAQEAAE